MKYKEGDIYKVDSYQVKQYEDIRFVDTVTVIKQYKNEVLCHSPLYMADVLIPKRELISLKTYYIMNNIGTAKYTINFHDGVQKHDDGSEFFAIAIFHNKRKFRKFITGLKKQGYSERMVRI